nr:MAG TPA: hypothetical protein [Caudoviricetes sp.]
MNRRNWNGLDFVLTLCLLFWALVALAVLKMVGG